MHSFRTHNCGELRAENAGSEVRLSGWVHRKRDHGNLLFLDLRDHFGLTQCVVEVDSTIFPQIEALKLEAVICITGKIAARDDDMKTLIYRPVKWNCALTIAKSWELPSIFRWRSIAIVTMARRRVCVIDFSICVAIKSTEI